MSKYTLSHLQQLEIESTYIIREVAAEFENPVMLYSIGKDSSVMLHLAKKAFCPGKIPFPFLHVDTSMKFREMYEFRDMIPRKAGIRLNVHINTQALTDGVNPWDYGTKKCCALLKTQALLDAIREGGYDAPLGGARREEEKSRAKERVFSFRDRHGQWDPKNQRPEFWNLYNSCHDNGESIRVFPLSNWTELDIWHYIYHEKIEVVPLYFAREREMIVRNGQLFYPDGPYPLEEGERPRKVMCRFRSLGCYPCSGAVHSEADTVEKIIEELISCQYSERNTRVIDHDTEGSMEKKKREGYF